MLLADVTNYTLEGTHGIWGPTNLTKSGAGRVTLNTPNGYRGVTSVQQGVLRVGHATALGSVSGATAVAAGAALEVLGGISMAEPLVLTGAGISGSGALRNVSGDNSLAGPVTLAGAASIQADAGTMTFTDAANIITAGLALTVGGPGNIVMNGTVNLGTGTLTKPGSGTVIISGRELTTGGVTIAAGTLQVGDGGFMTTTLGPVANDGHLLLFLDRVPPLPNLKDQPIQDRTSVISGSGHVTYRRDAEPQGEAGRFLLNDANTYTGGTTVAAQLSVTNPLAFGSGRVDILDGAEVTLGAGTITNAFTVRGRGVAALGSQSAAMILSGTTVQGAITLLGDARIKGPGTIAGPISGAFVLEVGGGATLRLTANSPLEGSLMILAGGNVSLGDGGAGGSLGPAAQIFNSGSLTVNRSDSAELPNAIHGTGNFSKLGTGTLTLSGNSDFTGGTTVEAGTLNLTGSLTGSPVTVRPYATLIAAGSLAKKLLVHAEGTLAPGLGVGELQAGGGLTLRPGSRLQFELNGADPTPGSGVNDLINVTGDLTLGRLLTFGNILNVAETVPGSFLTAAPGDTWTLFTYTGALIDSGLDLGTMPELSGDLEFAVSYNTPHEVNLTVVPEPTAGLFLLAGLGLLLTRRGFLP